jgi:hypothetical protein
MYILHYQLNEKASIWIDYLHNGEKGIHMDRLFAYIMKKPLHYQLNKKASIWIDYLHNGAKKHPYG